MQIRFIRLIDDLFKDAPHSLQTLELKEEMVQNLMEKYNDLRAEGKSEEDAFRIASASIGDVEELVAELTKGEPGAKRAAKRAERSARREPAATAEPAGAEFVVDSLGDDCEADTFADGGPAYRPADAMAAAWRRLVWVAAAGVACVGASAIGYVARTGGPAGAMMLALITAGAALMVFAAVLRSRLPDCVPAQGKTKTPLASLESGFWLLATAFFFLLSFRTGAWHLSWVVFVYASAVINLIKAAASPERKQVKGLINGAMWSFITGAYFIVSFHSGAWHITWLLFLVGTAFGKMILSVFKGFGK